MWFHDPEKLKAFDIRLSETSFNKRTLYDRLINLLYNLVMKKIA